MISAPIFLSFRELRMVCFNLGRYFGEKVLPTEAVSLCNKMCDVCKNPASARERRDEGLISLDFAATQAAVRTIEVDSEDSDPDREDRHSGSEEEEEESEVDEVRRAREMKDKGAGGRREGFRSAGVQLERDIEKSTSKDSNGDQSSQEDSMMGNIVAPLKTRSPSTNSQASAEVSAQPQDVERAQASPSAVAEESEHRPSSEEILLPASPSTDTDARLNSPLLEDLPFPASLSPEVQVLSDSPSRIPSPLKRKSPSVEVQEDVEMPQSSDLQVLSIKRQKTAEPPLFAPKPMEVESDSEEEDLPDLQVHLKAQAEEERVRKQQKPGTISTISLKGLWFLSLGTVSIIMMLIPYAPLL